MSSARSSTDSATRTCKRSANSVGAKASSTTNSAHKIAECSAALSLHCIAFIARATKHPWVQRNAMKRPGSLLNLFDNHNFDIAVAAEDVEADVGAVAFEVQVHGRVAQAQVADADAV